jgi:hypothetical protein
MERKINYFNFLGVFGIILMGRTDAYASQPRYGMHCPPMPPGVHKYLHTRQMFETLEREEDNETVVYVREFCSDNIKTWRKTFPESPIAFLDAPQDPCANLAAVIMTYAFHRDLENLQIALNACPNPKEFIERYPNLFRRIYNLFYTQKGKDMLRMTSSMSLLDLQGQNEEVEDAIIDALLDFGYFLPCDDILTLFGY